MDWITLLCGVFCTVVGFRCLPEDLRRPYGGGMFGVPVDVALIAAGVWMVMSA